MKRKVVFLTEVISPYRIPVFNEIGRSLGDRFLVFFFGETEKRRQWKVYKENIKFQYEVLPRILFQKNNSGNAYFFNPAIVYKLIGCSPEVIIIGGYHHPTSLLALSYAKLFRKRVILWCESNKYDYRSNHPVKEAYKRWFVRNCSGYVAPGEASFEYLIYLGAAAEKIWIAPNAVDNDYFSRQCNKHKHTKEAFKQSKGYPDKLLLYVGRLIDLKGILDLLKAFQILSSEQPDLGLLLIGSGRGRERYKDFCKMNNIKNVFFGGFVHQEELPLYYTASDVFVLPTHSDPWGLVLNEAMACKLPVISSDAAGAAQSLIVNGKNGYIFRKGDISQLAAYLKEILKDGQRRAGMAEASSEIINNYSPLKCAQGFIRAIREI